MKRIILALLLLFAAPSYATTRFMSTPDATQGTDFWTTVTNTVVYDNTTPTKSGTASWKAGNASTDQSNEFKFTMTEINTSGRISYYLRLNDLPSATSTILRVVRAGTGDVFRVRVTTGGVIQLANNSGTQIGSNGSTLTTGTWYQLTFTWTITNTTTYTITTFVGSTQDITASNSPTLASASPDTLFVGYNSPGANKFLNFQHVYMDNSSALTYIGDVRVTAKRPNANGNANSWTTQIGAGGSGYGTGHSPQVNERPLSTTNGWSCVNCNLLSEDYFIENAATGDIDLTGLTLVDYVCWGYLSVAAATEGIAMLCDGSSSTKTLTTTPTLFTSIKGSTTYPSDATGHIRFRTASGSTHTDQLYETGIIFAYIAPSTVRRVASPLILQ
jgi:hypothetical protein